MAKRGKNAPVYRTVTVEVHDPDPNRMGFFGSGKQRGDVLRKLTRRTCRILEKELSGNIDIHSVSLTVTRAERYVHGRMKPALLGTASITFSEWFSEG